MKFTEFLAKSLEESPGQPSSIRLQMLIVCLVTCVLPLMVWAILCLKKGEMLDFPGGVIGIATLLFGGATAAKVVQQRGE